MNSISNFLGNIQAEFDKLERTLHSNSERNHDQMKVLATVKCSLENIFKRNANVGDTIIECIDLLRSVTPHYSVNAGKTIIDPPTTDEEKEKIKNICGNVCQHQS